MELRDCWNEFSSIPLIGSIGVLPEPGWPWIALLYLKLGIGIMVISNNLLLELEEHKAENVEV